MRRSTRTARDRALRRRRTIRTSRIRITHCQHRIARTCRARATRTWKALRASTCRLLAARWKRAKLTKPRRGRSTWHLVPECKRSFLGCETACCYFSAIPGRRANSSRREFSLLDGIHACLAPVRAELSGFFVAPRGTVVGIGEFSRAVARFRSEACRATGQELVRGRQCQRSFEKRKHSLSRFTAVVFGPVLTCRPTAWKALAYPLQYPFRRRPNARNHAVDRDKKRRDANQTSEEARCGGWGERVRGVMGCLAGKFWGVCPAKG
jgi:hypothetical protein